jgi:hypothetical protein
MDVYRESPVGPWRLRMAVLALAGVVAGLSLLTFTGAAQAICLKPRITSVSFSPAEPVEGQPATVSVEVSNAGSTCESGPVELEFRPESSSTVVGASDELLLEANEVTTVNLPYTFTKARVLPYLTVTELWPADINRTIATSTRNQYVTVVKPTLPFGFERFGRGTCEEYVCTSPEPLLAGKQGTVELTLFNEGPLSAPAFSVKLTPNTKGFLPAAQTQTFAGAPGGYIGVGFPVTYSKPGTYVVKAELIPSDLDFTTTGLPKKVEGTVTVEEVQANIDFQEGPCGEQICLAEAPVVDNGNTASVKVRNTGKKRSGRFDVVFTPHGGGKPAVQTSHVEELNPGESRTLLFPVTYHDHGSFTSTAKIVPIAFKNTGQEKTEVPVDVAQRAAEVIVTLESFAAFLDPQGYEEWDVTFCADHYKQCTKQHFEPVLADNEYHFGAGFQVSLKEAQKLNATISIYSTDYFCFGSCHLEHVAYPGNGTLNMPRSEYLQAGGAGEGAIIGGENCRGGGTVQGTDGDCFVAFLHVTLLNHVGKE